MENRNTLTTLDLFSGAGGFSLGFFQAGFTPIFAIDNDKDSIASYNENFGHHGVTEDIHDIDDFPEADVIIGGPPCQGFSNLGTNMPTDPRNQLWRQYIRAVESTKPRAFVVENVPPFLSSQEGQQLIKAAQDIGYVVEGKVLNAADYGSFQTRKRTIIIGSRVGPATLPKQTHRGVNGNGKASSQPPQLEIWQSLPGWRTVRDAIGDLPFIPDERNLHVSRNPTALSLERYKHIPAGGNRFDLPIEIMPECWKKKKSGGTDLFGRLWWDRPSVTIRTEFYKPEKGRYLHPEANRPITLREGARIQGFPDSFRFVGSNVSIARQIGNAVPVQLAYAIALAVKEMILNG